MNIKSKQDEQYWIDAFRHGDEQALTYFFDLHYKPLCFFSTRMVQDSQEAEDIVADCFLKLWQRYPDFKTGQNIRAFLYITCRNACLNHLQHLKVRSTSQQHYLNQLIHDEETILYQIIKAEVLGLVDQEIKQLPEKMQEIFRLMYFEGKKTDEIAIKLNISVQTVRNQKSKAINILKTSLLKKGISAAVYLVFLQLM